MNVSIADIETALLKSFTGHQTDHRLCFLRERVRECLPSANQRADPHSVMQGVWSLVSKGLAYLDYSQPASSNWSLVLTPKGRDAANDAALNPDNVPAYLQRVAGEVPGLTAVPGYYLHEALRAYSSECYTAATVMLGVAAEAAFYDVAFALAAWLTTSAGPALDALLRKPTLAYIQKFVEFQRRLAASRQELPSELQHNLDLNINSVLELLRLARNEAGHPTGVKHDRHDTFQLLVVFPGLARRLYDLKSFFEQPRS